MHPSSLILHIPHAATAIPESALAHYKLSPEALRQEQLKLTDWFTDELFHGRAVIIDCHSFPEHCLPCHEYASPSDIAYCIGTDPYHTPEWLAAELEAALQSPAGRVVRDHPFSGSFVPTRYYRKDPRVLSIMIEVNRALYMDETTGRKNEHFQNTQKKLQSAIQGFQNRL